MTLDDFEHQNRGFYGRHQSSTPISYFTVVGLSLMKMVADRHGHAAYHNRH